MGKIVTVNVFSGSGAVTQAGFSKVGILIRVAGAADPLTRIQAFTGMLDVTDGGFAAYRKFYKATNATWGPYSKMVPEIKLLAQFDGESVADALNAAEMADSDWFGLSVASRSSTDIYDAAIWASGRIKFFCWSTESADCLTALSGTSTDVGGRLANEGIKSLALWHHEAGIELSSLTCKINSGVATFSLASVAQIENVAVLGGDGDYSITYNGATVTHNSAGAETNLVIRDALKILLLASATFTDDLTIEVGATDSDLKFTATDEGTPFALVVTANLTSTNLIPNATVAHGLRSVDKIVFDGILVNGATSDELNNTELQVTVISNDQFSVPTTEAGVVTGNITAYARCKYGENAWLGRKLPLPEGGVIWTYAKLSGIAASDAYLTPTEKNNLGDRFMHFMTKEGLDTYVSSNAAGNGGQLTDGTWADIFVGECWLKARTAEAIRQLEIDSDDGISIDASGYSDIERELQLIGGQAVTNRFLTRYPDGRALKVTFIDPDKILTADLANRTIPGIKVSALIRQKGQTVEISYYLQN